MRGELIHRETASLETVDTSPLYEREELLPLIMKGNEQGFLEFEEIMVILKNLIIASKTVITVSELRTFYDFLTEAYIEVQSLSGEGFAIEAQSVLEDFSAIQKESKLFSLSQERDGVRALINAGIAAVGETLLTGDEEKELARLIEKGRAIALN